MISQRKPRIYLDRRPRFDDMLVSLEATARLPRSMISEMECERRFQAHRHEAVHFERLHKHPVHIVFAYADTKKPA